eukprot:SAG31_NODE_245_length_19224_cov_10.210614_12_plen_70_part_00
MKESATVYDEPEETRTQITQNNMLTMPSSVSCGVAATWELQLSPVKENGQMSQLTAGGYKRRPTKTRRS